MTPPPARPEGAAAAPALDSELDGFDVREFARTARGSHRNDPIIRDFDGSGVSGEAAHLVRVLRDLERTTLDRMRNLLVTATHKDARVTAFLTTWAFEKFWIADALDAVLERLDAPPASAPEAHRRTPFAERAERRGPVRRAIQANFDGVQIVAAHVTTGLVDEWIAQAAYRRLAALSERLGHVASLVIEIKDRHIRFLSDEAERRLAASSRARRLTQKAIRQAVWPIGAVGRPAADRSFFETIVFGGDGLEARRISELVAALPGLASVAPTVAARLAP